MNDSVAGRRHGPSGLLVSVVIPAHNAQETLASCIDSVFADSYRPVEVIVVDDGSTDRTLDVARSYASRHPGEIRVVAQSHRGGSSARNSGLDTARGDLVQFLDSDDELCNDKLAASVAAFAAESRLVCVYSDGLSSDGTAAEVIGAHHGNVQRLAQRTSSEFTCALNTNLPIWKRKFLLDGSHYWCEDLPCWQETEYYLRLLTSLSSPDQIRHIPLVGVRFNRTRGRSGVSSAYWSARYILGQRMALLEIAGTCAAVGMWGDPQKRQQRDFFRALLLRSVVGGQAKAWQVLAQEVRNDDSVLWRFVARLPFALVNTAYRWKRRILPFRMMR